MSSQKPPPKQQDRPKPSSDELARRQAELKAQIERHFAKLRKKGKR
ncbi:hypothetical protein ACQUSR_20410 [Streptomyces sp. P1-3]